MPSLPILPASLPFSTFSNRSISSCKTFNGPDPFLPLSTPSSSSFSPAPIRMGGGPRTFPGGVSKWQWKRMQAKKSKQLLKARLCRERQLYEMRKRAELKSAISELERPWEVTQRAPVLFSVSVDEQIKALADRFQRPCGFDMWSEKDGPRIFTGKNGKEWGNRESFCSDSELVISGSRKVEEEIDGKFGRNGGDRGSFRWDSNLAVYDSKIDSRFESHSDSYGYSRTQRQEIPGDFDRRHGRGNRSSHRSHSELRKEDSEGEITKRSAYHNASAGGFDRRSGNRGSFRSYSELPLADSRSGHRNASAGAFDRRWNRNSYVSESEIQNVGFRKGRIQNAEGRDRDYGDERDDARRVRKWSDGKNNIFRSSRGTGRKD